jgi:hypothetical protein
VAVAATTTPSQWCFFDSVHVSAYLWIDPQKLDG